MISNLRMGDIVSQWNESQYLVILSHSGEEAPQGCPERIEKAFERNFGNTQAVLFCELEAL